MVKSEELYIYLMEPFVRPLDARKFYEWGATILSIFCYKRFHSSIDKFSLPYVLLPSYPFPEREKLHHIKGWQCVCVWPWHDWLTDWLNCLPGVMNNATFHTSPDNIRRLCKLCHMYTAYSSFLNEAKMYRFSFKCMTFGRNYRVYL